jgi:hypothetical protein
VVNKATAEKIRRFFAEQPGSDEQDSLIKITVA